MINAYKNIDLNKLILKRGRSEVTQDILHNIVHGGETLKQIKHNIDHFKLNFFRGLNRCVYFEKYSKRIEPIIWRDRPPIREIENLLSSVKGDFIGEKTFYINDEIPELDDVKKEFRKIYKDLFNENIDGFVCSVRYCVYSSLESEKIYAQGKYSDFHLDESRGMTYVQYLSDVGLDDGPFEYINRDILIDGWLRYILSLGTHKKLPKELTEVGNLTFPDLSSVDDNLSINTLTGDAGSAILFSGFSMLHRGGKPRNGKRISLFLQPIIYRKSKILYQIRNIFKFFILRR